MKIGIVGLPNVGKSTLFNALLGANQACASNFPFCTIEPNTGIVPVPDDRLTKLAELEKSQQIVPPMVEFVDIAGLVKGASQGQGLGNKFLSHIREVDAIVHVVRLFEDENITHVAGAISPQDDIATIDLELILADLESVTKGLDRVVKTARGGDKTAQTELATLTKIKAGLEQEKPVRALDLPADELAVVKSFGLLTAKPILYIVNLSEGQITNSTTATKLEQLFSNPDSYIALSAKAEAELAELSASDRAEYLQGLGLTEPGLPRLIRAGYKLLGLITFFTAGEKETKGWTIKKGSTAPQAAGAIHTDFEKGFIRAETVAYDDFINNGGWAGAKPAGKVRSEGKDYIVHDGDVMLFRFNV
jgi:ribosome-binding ATPase